MNTAAIVLAAGEGSRMKSKHSKVTHCILEKPLVRWVVDAAKQADVEKVITVVGHGRAEVEPLVSDTVTVVQEQQLGTANAVSVCKEALADFDGSLLVLTGDSPRVTADTLRACAAHTRSQSGSRPGLFSASAARSTPASTVPKWDSSGSASAPQAMARSSTFALRQS